MVELLAQAEVDQAVAGANELGVLAYVVLGGYLVMLLVLGVLGWRRSTNSEEDYYLAGRDQGWIVSSVTIMATFFSSFALFGAPGAVYRDGVAFALFSLNVPVGGLTVALVGSRIAKLARAYGYVTPGDMVSSYYGSRWALRVLVAVTGFLYAVPYVVMQMQAGGLISEKFFGEGYFASGAIVLAMITTLYIMIGGMRSVAWTDVIQGVLLISGMVVGGLAMFLVFGGPANFGQRIMEELPDSSLVAPGNAGRWSWTMLLTVCLLASTGSMIQPAQWMRYCAARSARTLQRGGVIFATVLTFSYLAGVMLIGLAGQVLYPLSFEMRQEVTQGPAALEVPAELGAQFRYEAPTEGAAGAVVWTWSGRQPVGWSANVQTRLSQLSDNREFRSAIARLGTQCADPQQATVLPHPRVDPNPHDGAQFDSILIVVLREKLPQVLGVFGSLFAVLMVVAIMAASMSTADSNLHALSAVMTRDIYDQFLRPQASNTERVWVGRSIILATTALALWIVISGRNEQLATRFGFLNMIMRMGLMAIAFSAQLLPITIDMLFLRRGTRAGAIAGLSVGLITTLVFGPLFEVLSDSLGQPGLLQQVQSWVQWAQAGLHVDSAAWGLLANIPVFICVSALTKPVSPRQRSAFAKTAG